MIYMLAIFLARVPESYLARVGGLLWLLPYLIITFAYHDISLAITTLYKVVLVVYYATSEQRSNCLTSIHVCLPPLFAFQTNDTMRRFFWIAAILLLLAVSGLCAPKNKKRYAWSNHLVCSSAFAYSSLLYVSPVYA